MSRETIHKINIAYNVEILLKGCPLYSEDMLTNREIFGKVHVYMHNNIFQYYCKHIHVCFLRLYMSVVWK